MIALIMIAGLIVASLAVLVILLAGLNRRVVALTDRLEVTRERAQALERALANLPAGRQ